MNQPLNEAYKHEVLEAYQKISDTFDNFTQLMRKRVPYEEWPDHCKSAIPSIGCDAPATPIQQTLKQPEHVNIPDASGLSLAILGRIQDIGRAQEKLQSILDDDMFDNLSKHDPYWHPTIGEEIDRLYDIRMKMSFLHENLWKVMGILNKNEE